MRTDDFDYDLPSGRIAQTPVEPRSSSRLLVLDRASGQIDHRTFADIVGYIDPGDLLVLNETRVLPARLHGVKKESGGAVEILLLRERYEGTWECLVRPGRRLKPGVSIVFGEGLLTGFVMDILEESGGRLVRFQTSTGSLLDAFHAIGEVPLPPYITRPLDIPDRYQTVYATNERSVAAPTAGLHFTQELLDAIVDAGARLAKVELDVGLDTFRPVAEDDPERHVIHREYLRVPERTAKAVNETKAEGGRVISVGTTTARALESAVDPGSGEVRTMMGETDLFILPGYRFAAVDVLLTNFHMPRSTLLMMVSAFAGRDLVFHAYESAKQEGYRFLSFGDAMLIV